MMFSLYNSCEGILLADLIRRQEREELVARAEDSGSEGIYVEVAAFNEKTLRWEKLAFRKFFGGELPDQKDADAAKTAETIVAVINAAGKYRGRAPVLNRLPSYGMPGGTLKELFQATSEAFGYVPDGDVRERLAKAIDAAGRELQ